MRHLRSFTITYVPMTNTKPARVKIYDNRFKTYRYASFTDTEKSRVEDVAEEYLRKRGIICSVVSEAKKGFLLLTNDFNPIP